MVTGAVSCTLAIALVAGFQNCSGFKAAVPSTLTTSLSSTSGGSSTSSNTSAFLNAVTNAASLLSLADLGLSSSDLATLSASNAQAGTLTASSVTAAQNNIVAALGTNISKLSSSEASFLAPEVNSALNLISAYDSSTLTPQAQLLQTAYTTILNALLSNLTAAGVSLTSGSDNTAAFTATLANIDVSLTSALTQAGLDPGTLTPISASALTAGTVTASSANAGLSAMLSLVSSNMQYMSYVSDANKTTYLAQVNDAIAQLSAYDPTTLSTQAQILRTANLTLLNTLKSDLGG